jgi:hypothetical protein
VFVASTVQWGIWYRVSLWERAERRRIGIIYELSWSKSENRKLGGKNEVKRVVNESCTLSPAQGKSICCVKEREKSGLEPKDWDNKLLTDPKNKDRKGKSN